MFGTVRYCAHELRPRTAPLLHMGWMPVAPLVGELVWGDGVKQGMFAPIGEGDIDFKAIVEKLNEAGFDGYYVLEQDIMLEDEPSAGGGPIDNARKSFEALKALA